MCQDLITSYRLEPHPEGGYYREIYRSDQIVLSPVHGKERNALTHIYFLLARGQISRFHSVVHDEVWNFYKGAPLRLLQHDGKATDETMIGPGCKDMTATVRGGTFQAAETTGDYSLVGCTVAPGFDFEDFSFLSDNHAASKALDPAYTKFL